MFKFNEEKYGILSTYDSSLSTYTYVCCFLLLRRLLCIDTGVYLKPIKVGSKLGVSPRVPLERDNSEEFLKREARAAQLAEEIEASASYKARVALENDERSEEEKYTAVMRGERDPHTLGR